MALELLALFSPQASLGAEVYLYPDFTQGSSQIVIVGEIVSGDANKFHSLLLTTDRPVSVAIYSPGGDLIEAMTIGQEIREQFLTTHTANSWSCSAVQKKIEHNNFWTENVERVTACQCYSACFVIWAAGIYRSGGDNSQSEYAGTPGLTKYLRPEPTFIGIHRPRFDEKYFADLDAKEAKRLYDSMMSDLQRYLVGMDVPNAITQRVISVASDELHYLSEDERLSLASFVPAVDEWLISKCGQHYSKKESRDRDALIHKSEWNENGNELRLSIPEQNYMAILDEKDRNRSQCWRAAIKEEQRLRAPGR